jgi:hypothetical protein
MGAGPRYHAERTVGGGGGRERTCRIPVIRYACRSQGCNAQHTADPRQLLIPILCAGRAGLVFLTGEVDLLVEEDAPVHLIAMNGNL